MTHVRSLDDIIGQDEAVRQLQALAELHNKAGRPVPHVLLVGGEGMGKHALVYGFAQQYGLSIREPVSENIVREWDFTTFLSTLKEHDVLVLNGLESLPSSLVGFVRNTLRTGRIDTLIEQGPDTKKFVFHLPPFTCFGFVEAVRECPERLREAFDVLIELADYRPSAMHRLITRLVVDAGLAAEDGVIDLLTQLTGGNPGYASKLVGWLALRAGQEISVDDAKEVMEAHGLRPRTSSGTAVPGDWDSTPATDFEMLVRELLSRMGFRLEMATLADDGGVEIVASLDRPFLRGRYLIQCKKYEAGNAVGVQTVRELYGVLRADPTAVKGILITTSMFTPHAWEFAKNLPIELIDGEHLRELLMALGDTGTARLGPGETGAAQRMLSTGS